MIRAKGKLYMNEEDIREVFSIPDNVHIKDMKFNPYTNELEILLFSVDKVEGFTDEARDYHSIRRRGVIK